MAREGERVHDRIIAAGASFALAAICGAAAWWLFAGLGGGVNDAQGLGVGRAPRVQQGLAVLGIFAVLAGLATLFFAGVGVYTLVKRPAPAEPERVEDDPEYWKRFPAPKE